RRHRIWRPPAVYNDRGIAGAFLLDHPIQQGGILGMKSNAAMRSGSTQPRDVIAAVNRVPLVKEDGVGHWRIVIGLGEPHPLKAFRRVNAARGREAVSSGRNRPNIEQSTILDD